MSANLTGAHLTGASLIGASLYDSDLTDADFTGAAVHRATLGKIARNSSTPRSAINRKIYPAFGSTGATCPAGN